MILAGERMSEGAEGRGPDAEEGREARDERSRGRMVKCMHCG